MPVYSDINQQGQNPFLVKDIEAVMQSIKTILATALGERLFLPTFGAQMEGLLFEPMDDITQRALLSEVIASVHKWDSRIELVHSRSSVIADPANNRYDVTLIFNIIGLEGQQFKYEGVIAR